MRAKMFLTAAALALPLAWTTLPASGANWHNPYGNVDHSNDAGNNTGDSQVDNLNDSQLNQNYRGPYYYRGQGGPPAGYQPMAAAPPPGYAPMAPPPPPAPPGYAPPPPPAPPGY
jgi:hypothetical protein